MLARTHLIIAAALVTIAAGASAGQGLQLDSPRVTPWVMQPRSPAGRTAADDAPPVGFSDLIEVVQWHGGRESLGKAGEMYVLVGEVRNISPHTIASVVLWFRVYDHSLRPFGWGPAPVTGARTMRVTAAGANSTVLAPGDIGIFKVYTGLLSPWEVAAEQVFSTSAEIVTVEPPHTNVSLEEPQTLVGGRILNGSVVNHGPAVASVARLAAAQFVEDMIVNAATTEVSTPVVALPCGGESATILQPGQRAPFTIDFGSGSAVTTADRIVTYWREIGTLDHTTVALPAAGGTRALTLTMESAGWCAASSVPWIAIIEGASGSDASGTVTYTVQPNPGAARTGVINVSGMLFIVTQAGGYACEYAVTPSAVVLGTRAASATISVTTESVCAWTAGSDSSWVSIVPGAGTGSGTFTIDAQSNSSDAPRSATIRVGGVDVSVRQHGTGRPFDVNLDGHMDLIWQHRTSGALAAWMMNGGTLLSGTLLTPPQVTDPLWSVAGGADLNRDGRPDLVWHHQGDGRLAAWMMDGTTQISGQLLSPEAVPDTGWHVRAVADMNADSYSDLLWQHDDGRLAVWLMRGDTAMSGHLLDPSAVADTDWQLVGSGDFDADGAPDIVWQHADGRIAVWIMSGTSLREGHLVSPAAAGPGWTVRAVGDLNGDGSPDLVMQNQEDGHVEAWLMMGSTRSAAVSLGQVPDVAWRIAGPR